MFLSVVQKLAKISLLTEKRILTSGEREGMGKIRDFAELKIYFHLFYCKGLF